MGDRLFDAVNNNVSWCDLVCRAAGIPTETRGLTWATLRRSPPFYPDVITLSPHATSSDVAKALVAGPGCSVKDSFACLDLHPDGLQVLFEAHWIYKPPEMHPADDSTWTEIKSDSEREAWLYAAGGDVAIPPSALGDPSVCVLATERDGQIVSGAIANQSGAVVGVSNLFGPGWSDAATWASLAADLAMAFPTMPLVGYEAGDALDAAAQAGFQKIGPLRVWLQPAEQRD